MIIRPTEAPDFPHVARLTNVYIRTSAIHFGDRDQSPEELRALWRDARATHPWYTAEVDGRFAGYAKSGAWRERAAYRRTAETAIYVEESARRTGVGRALYAALIDDLRARGFHTIVAGVTLPNEASVRFHESLGFRYVATFSEVGRKFDRWHDVGFWQLMLGDGSGGPRA